MRIKQTLLQNITTATTVAVEQRRRWSNIINRTVRTGDGEDDDIVDGTMLQCCGVFDISRPRTPMRSAGGARDTTPGLSGDLLLFDRVGVRMMSRVYLKDAINDYSHGHFFFNFTAKQVKITRWIHHAGDGKKRRTEGGHVFLGTINVRAVLRRMSISTCGDHGETEMTSSKPALISRDNAEKDGGVRRGGRRRRGNPASYPYPRIDNSW